MTSERDASTDFSRRVDFPYWGGLANGRLRVQRCTRCERWQWPADWRCPACGSYDFDWPQVDPDGIVYSWIRTHYPFVPALADELPYVSLLVELPQAGGARLLGHLAGPGSPHVGDAVTGTFVPASARTGDLAVLQWQLRDGG